MAEEERICRILSESERAGAHLTMERPLRIPDLLRAERLIGHIADSRQTLCPTVRPEEVLPEPDKTRFCKLLTENIESVIRRAEQVGAIERPNEFTGLIYWGDRLKKAYQCESE